MKALRIIPALILVAALLVLPVSATLGFIPSVAEKDAEFVSSNVNFKGEAIVGTVKSADSTIVLELTDANTSIVSIGNIGKAPAAVREALKKAEKQITENPVSSLVKDFAEAWKDATGGAPVENAVVAHMFDISTKVKIPAGVTVDFTVANPLEDKNAPVLVLHNYEGDKWEIVPHTRNAKGDIIISVTGLSPFVIITDSAKAPAASAGAPKSPSTVEESVSFAPVMLVVACAVLSVATVKVTRKAAK